MRRWLILLCGVLTYALFLGTFCYAVGFVLNVWVPKGIDDGEVRPLGVTLLVDAAFLGLFAAQHTVMARPAFKAWLTRAVPQPMERSCFVLATCAILIGLYVFWLPMPEPIWRVESAGLRLALHAASAVGWVIVLYSTFLIDHFELFGLKQAIYSFRGRPMPQPRFVARSLYRHVRNPLMLGFLIAFWAAPTMSLGRLLWCLLTTGYILIGVRIEERDLARQLGEEYRSYRRRTPMLFPRLPRFGTARPTDDAALAAAGNRVGASA